MQRASRPDRRRVGTVRVVALLCLLGGCVLALLAVLVGAHSAEGEHPFRSKPNTGSSQAEHHRSEPTRLLW
jgi:hypothetical protein